MDARNLSASNLPGFEPVNPWKSAQLVITRRRLPHFEVPGATYFVKFRCGWGRALGDRDRSVVLGELHAADGAIIDLDAAAVMPDRAHAIFRLLGGQSLERALQRIKGRTARRINRALKIEGRLWFDESFDHIVRDGNDLDEKIEYIRQAPVKEGLASIPEQYEWLFVKLR